MNKKQLSPLEALSKLYLSYISEHQLSLTERHRCKETIKKTLKAFDIIKGFVDFNVYEMQGKYYLTTGNNYCGQISISKEKFDLLKEVLL